MLLWASPWLVQVLWPKNKKTITKKTKKTPRLKGFSASKCDVGKFTCVIFSKSWEFFWNSFWNSFLEFFLEFFFELFCNYFCNSFGILNESSLGVSNAWVGRSKISQNIWRHMWMLPYIQSFLNQTWLYFRNVNRDFLNQVLPVN